MTNKWLVCFFEDEGAEPAAEYYVDSREQAEELIDEVISEKPHVVGTTIQVDVLPDALAHRGTDELHEPPMDPTGIDCIERYEGGDV